MSSGSESRSKVSGKRTAQVEEYIKSPAKLNAAVANSTTKIRKSPHARAMAKGNENALKRSVYNILWNKVPPDRRQKIAEVICNEWNYCNNRGGLAEIQAIIHIITGIVKPILIPVCVWVFVIQYRMLDELCECDNRDLPFKFKGWAIKASPVPDKKSD